MIDIILRRFVFVFLLLPVSAFASDYGRWICPECAIKTRPDGAQPNIEMATTFIRSTQITSRWKMNDVITICDGKDCMLVIFLGSAWVAAGPSYTDSRAKYKNGAAPTVAFNDQGGTNIEVLGHYEWWEFYQDGYPNPYYTTEPQFVIDSIRYFTPAILRPPNKIPMSAPVQPTSVNSTAPGEASPR